MSGTPTVGIPTPAMVGRPVRWKAERSVGDGPPLDEPDVGAGVLDAVGVSLKSDSDAED